MQCRGIAVIVATIGSRPRSRQRVHVLRDRANLIVAEHTGKRRHYGRVLLGLRDTGSNRVGYELDAPVAIEPRLVGQTRRERCPDSILAVTCKAETSRGAAVEDIAAEREAPLLVSGQWRRGRWDARRL